MQASRLKTGAIRLARRCGWDIRRFNPYLSAADYLGAVVFPQLSVDCVLDVGAHYGEFAQRIRDSGYDGRIISFEPIASNFERLEQNASADSRWSVHNIALGRTDEHASMNVMQNTVFSSLRSPLSVGVEEFGDYGNIVDRQETIEVRSLDGIFAALTTGIAARRVFLKMDTQGWDLDVVAGAATSLESVVALQSEMSIRPLYDDMPDYRTALSIYEQLGFAISSLYPVAWDRALRVVEFDCIMVRTAQDAEVSDRR